MTGQGTGIRLTFHGDTAELLHRTPGRDGTTVAFPLSRRASLKDIIESLGIPHTEVGMIMLDGEEQGFERIPRAGEEYAIHPLSPEAPPTVATFLRPEPLPECRFLVDINVGRLAGRLRMAGLDTLAVAPDQSAGRLVRQAVRDHRILLTRNGDLLRHRLLVFGRLVRSQDPDEQLAEIIRLYRLQDQLRPFTRCLACNGLLAEVDKAAILDRLLPLTRKYFDRFKQCPDCGHIYWQGSHHQKMSEKLQHILGRDPDRIPGSH